MNSFSKLKQNVKIKRYISSDFGTMYFQPGLPRDKKIIIRHFDNKISIELFPVYVDLYNSILNFINSNLSDIVFMPELLEVGEDYFIRQFYVYHIAIRDYLLDKDDEDYIKPPELFHVIQTKISEVLSNDSNQIITSILGRSLLEPTSKTIYDHKTDKLLVVQPKVSLEDLQRWKEIMS